MSSKNSIAIQYGIIIVDKSQLCNFQQSISKSCTNRGQLQAVRKTLRQESCFLAKDSTNSRKRLHHGDALFRARSQPGFDPSNPRVDQQGEVRMGRRGDSRINKAQITSTFSLLQMLMQIYIWYAFITAFPGYINLTHYNECHSLFFFLQVYT